MRAVAAFVSVLAWGVAWAQTPAPTLADALACERADDPPVCLMRAGAAGLSNPADEDFQMLSAAMLLGFDRGPDALALGPDESGWFAVWRAVGETLRRSAGGATPIDALAPIAALGGEHERDGYRLLTYRADDWARRLPAPREATTRLALTRLEAAADEDDIPAIAMAYARNGLAADGRTLLRAWRAEDRVILFWLDVNDFAAAERAARARDVHLQERLSWVAWGALNAGERVRAVRLAREAFAVTPGSGRINLTANISADVATIMARGGDARGVPRLARSLVRGVTPSDENYGTRIDDAIAMLRIAGAVDEACRLARTQAANVDAGADADEVAWRAEEAAIRAAECGRLAESRALAVRAPGAAFAIAHALQAPTPDLVRLAASADLSDLEDAIRADMRGSVFDRARALLAVMAARDVYGAFELARREQASGRPELMTDTHGQAFAAMRARLVRDGRAVATPINDDDRMIILQASIALIENEFARGVREAPTVLPD